MPGEIGLIDTPEGAGVWQLAAGKHLSLDNAPRPGVRRQGLQGPSHVAGESVGVGGTVVVREVDHDPQHDLAAAISCSTPRAHGRIGRGGAPIQTTTLGPDHLA